MGRPRKEITNDTTTTTLILPTQGEEIIRTDQEIEVADGPIQDNYADELKFNEEVVEVIVADSTDINADNPVALYCNGVSQFVWRNQPQRIKRKFVEILARAKQTAISTVENRYEGTTNIRKTQALRYPFQVTFDPNPNGQAWLRKLQMEA